MANKGARNLSEGYLLRKSLSRPSSVVVNCVSFGLGTEKLPFSRVPLQRLGNLGHRRALRLVTCPTISFVFL